MTIYIINAILTALISKGLYTYTDEYGVETQWSRNNKKTRLFFILLFWGGLYALRGITGSDAIGYRSGYLSIQSSGLTLNDLFAVYRDKLYQVLTYTISTISDGSWIAMCAATGVLIYVPILKIIREKSEDIQLSLLLFLFSLDAYFGYNGVRQMIAVSLSMYAYYFFLREKKFTKYALLILLASGFHVSMLLVVPFHILSLRKLKSFSTILLLGFAAVSCFAFGSVWSLFTNLFSDNIIIAKYSNTLVEGNGSGIIRVFVYLAPVVLSLMNYGSLDHDSDDSDIMMMLFAAIFMIYSMFSVSFSQMAIYFSISNTILVPKVLNSANRKNYYVLRQMIVVLYFMYMIVLLLNGDMGLNPYVPVWKSGSY